MNKATLNTQILTESEVEEVYGFQPSLLFTKMDNYYINANDALIVQTSDALNRYTLQEVEEMGNCFFIETEAPDFPHIGYFWFSKIKGG